MISRAGAGAPVLVSILFLLLATLWVAPPEIHPAGALMAVGLMALTGILAAAGGSLGRTGDAPMLAAMVLPLGLSHLFAVDQGAAVDRWVLVAGAALLFAVGRGLDGAAARAIAVLLVAGGGIAGMHGVWQYVGGIDVLLAGSAVTPEVAERLLTYRVFGRFLLPSVLASFLLLTLPLSLVLLVRVRGPRRLAAAVATLAMATALLLTRSHGALVALLAAVVLSSAPWLRRQPRRAALAAVLVLAGLGLVVVARGGVLWQDAAAEGPAALRLRNTTAALQMIADHPVAGTGGGSFGSAYTAYRRAGDNETRFVHDTYLQLVAEHGLPVLLPMFVMLLALRRRLLAARHGSSLAAALAFGLLAFLLHNVMDISGLLQSTLWTAALAAGVLLPLAGQARTPTFASGRAAQVAVAVAAAAILALGWGAALSSSRVERARDALATGRVTEAYDAARKAEFWAPWEAGPPLLQAEILLGHPQVADGGAAAALAVAAASRCIRRNRSWPAAHRVRALAHLGRGDAGAAAADLWLARSLYPLATHYDEDMDRLERRLQRRAEGDVAQP